MLYAKRFNVECAPLKGKIPFRGYRFVRNEGVYQAKSSHWDKASGYFVAPITGSLLAIIDIDSPQFYNILLTTFPFLKHSFTVRRGDHYHVYVILPRPIGAAYISAKDDNRHEIASLRGVGSYVVGPYSRHKSGDIYTPLDDSASPAELTSDQFDTLLQIGEFELPSDPVNITASSNESMPRLHSRAMNPRLIQAISNHLLMKGGKATHPKSNGEIWINGPCPFSDKHKSGIDRHWSFGMNTATGHNRCHACGKSFRLKDIVTKLGISIGELGGLYAENDPYADERITARGIASARMIEDIASALPSPMVTRQQLVEYGDSLGWSRAKSYNAINFAIETGRLKPAGKGIYLRSSQSPSGQLPFDRKAYQGHVANWRAAHVLKVQQELQKKVLEVRNGASQPYTARGIARKGGNISRATLHRYESLRLAIRRHPVILRYDLPKTLSAQQAILTQDRAGTYTMLDVINRAGVLVERIDHHSYEFPVQALLKAHKLASASCGKVVIAEHRGAIRVLPGQQIEQLIPDGGKLVNDKGTIHIDQFAWPLPRTPRKTASRPNAGSTHTQPNIDHVPNSVSNVRKRIAEVSREWFRQHQEVDSRPSRSTQPSIRGGGRVYAPDGANRPKTHGPEPTPHKVPNLRRHGSNNTGSPDGTP